MVVIFVPSKKRVWAVEWILSAVFMQKSHSHLFSFVWDAKMAALILMWVEKICLSLHQKSFFSFRDKNFQLIFYRMEESDGLKQINFSIHHLHGQSIARSSSILPRSQDVDGLLWVSSVLGKIDPLLLITLHSVNSEETLIWLT